MVILEARNSIVRIQGKTILHNISLSLQAGRRTAIIGPNGSGKSTLLKALCGLLTVTQGEILVEGKAIHSYRKRDLAQKLAILPQGAAIPADLTVGDLVDCGRFPHRSWWGGNDDAADRRAVAWSLRQTNLEALKSRLINTLSGGERQRAWIAMALAQRPQALLLDEPTTYLDIAHQLEIMQLISDLNKANGLSVVMVLHDLNHALQYADDIAVVKDGRIFAFGSPQQVLTVELLQQVFGVTADFFVNTHGDSLLAPLQLSKKNATAKT